MRWLLQVLIAIDQLVNALCGGWADESLSARAFRSGWYWRRRAINALFFWQDDHWKAAWVAEVTRRQLPPQYRQDVRT